MREVLVGDLMTAEELVVLHRSESLPSAAELMKLARIRHLPVVDDRKRLVGLVTHRDVLAAQVGGAAQLDDDARGELQLGVPVARIMRRQVWTVRPEQPALDAARLLHDLEFGCVPVVDGERTLVGIVTEADFLELASRSLDGDSGSTDRRDDDPRGRGPGPRRRAVDGRPADAARAHPPPAGRRRRRRVGWPGHPPRSLARPPQHAHRCAAVSQQRHRPRPDAERR